MNKGSYKYNFAKVKTLESIRSQKLNPLHASQSQYVAREPAVHTEKAETTKAKKKLLVTHFQMLRKARKTTYKPGILKLSNSCRLSAAYLHLRL